MILIQDEEQLDRMLSVPSEALIMDLKKLEGDFMILGAAGKMGPSLTTLLINGLKSAGSSAKVFAVSRFSNSTNRQYLEDHGVNTIAGDLLDPSFLNKLPQAENVIYLAGQKFGTSGNQAYTWAMNTWLPGLVCQKFSKSNIVAFSTGNIYPLMPTDSRGATESTQPGPIGEYAQSCLGRERIFEYFSLEYHTPVLIYRLNYALDLRYGVLNDIGQKVWNQKPIDLTMGHVNVIWQGDANEYAIRSLLHCTAPANHLNITGPEVLPVEELAKQIGIRLDKTPTFTGSPQPTALLNDAAKSFDLFGPPKVSIEQMLDWTAQWIREGGKLLNKPTHFETRDGKF
ncbi:MAG: NAD(P)-dependent oxidoreductase [Saprospiraceae bacterium]|nr:NAD(P)-dependent oxidoreductase [Saprospiraceae bacterium]